MQTQSWTIDDIVVTRIPQPFSRSWVAVGSAPDMRHLLRTWELMLRFNFQDIPENGDIYWDLLNVLVQHSRRGTVRVTEMTVEIDRRKLKQLRDGLDWFYTMVADEHADDHYEWTAFLNHWTRKDDAPQPITELDDARRALIIIDSIMDITADNVVRLADREVA
ncbi:hypothetical protein ASF70_12765 [Rhizobium sp. Leaf321]|uniref:hypothetical protein n=1 Tax=Rhizobium sp. Leaf321 TaxID=1736335 RepID=UPI000715F24E|nr:hypothetical protein [Rhizobium sp. Leaf321]KQQ72400.1 hypothetical protein ASF70_12765 [Rhizobium sp. Leaf321]